MPLFINTLAEATSAGVYALEITPPRVIQGVSSGYVGLVGQFEWGPKQAVYTPADAGDFYDTFAPAGAPRAASGYYAVMRRRGLPLKIVRVLGAGSAAASAAITGTGGTQTPTAKYHGTLGNAITVTYAAASGGDATKRDVTVQLTDPVTGTTIEVYRDQALPAPNAAGAIDVSASKLLASFAIAANAAPAWPANGTTALSNGANGAAAGAADYTGTAGTADKGCALFETEDEVRVVVHDDCGNTNRAAINSGFAAHAAATTDRIAVLEGNPDAADYSTVEGYVTGGLVSDRVIFAGAWVKVLDDAGVAQTAPLSTMVAAALVGLEPHQSHAWWDDAATKYYEAVQAIVASFSTKSAEIRRRATLKGIALPVQLKSGKFAVLHDRTTSQTPGKVFAVRRRVADYLALSLVLNFPSYVNGPNVEDENREIKLQVDNFLDREVARKRVVAFSTNIAAPVNTAASIANGDFSIAIDAQTPAPRERIFLLMNVGPTVTVTEQPAT